MEITTRVCDICYYQGSFNEQDVLHDCGELGDLCGEHFKEVYNYITKLKKRGALPETTLMASADNKYIAKGTDVNSGEEVAVTFDANGKVEPRFVNESGTRKPILPWLS